MSKSDKWPPDWWMGGKMSKSGKAAAGTAAGITLGGMIGTAIKNIKNRRDARKEQKATEKNNQAAAAEIDPNTAINYIGNNKKKKKKNN